MHPLNWSRFNGTPMFNAPENRVGYLIFNRTNGYMLPNYTFQEPKIDK